MIWKEVVKHKNYLMERVKNRCIFLHKHILSHYFNKLKITTDKVKMDTLCIETEDMINTNQNLANELSKKVEVR